MAEAAPKIEVQTKLEYQPAFAVRLERFLRVKPFVSKEETRYYLNGVFVRPAEVGAECIGTDGHRMGMARDIEGRAWRSGIFKVPSLLKMPPKRDLIATPWLVGMVAGSSSYLAVVNISTSIDAEDRPDAAVSMIDNCEMRFGHAMIDGTYPDVDKVFPRGDGVGYRTVGFNGEYLKSFGKQIKIGGVSDSEPYLVRDCDDADFVGIVMPVRADGQAGRPAWMKPAA